MRNSSALAPSAPQAGSAGVPGATTVRLVGKSETGDCWHVIRPLLVPALAKGGGIEAADMLEHLRSGLWQLWVAECGKRIMCALVTRIVIEGDKRIFRAVAVGGKLPLMWRQIISDIEWLAAEQGCTHSEVGEDYVRKGWKRLLRGGPRVLRKEAANA